jgi:hypothetical protein
LDEQPLLGTFIGSFETSALGLAFSASDVLALGVVTATDFDEGTVLD